MVMLVRMRNWWAIKYSDTMNVFDVLAVGCWVVRVVIALWIVIYIWLMCV